jgi:N-acetylglucosamine-6-phosphate deacetylase
MNSGEVTAWHFATGQPVRLRWQNGTISAVEPALAAPPRDLWIAPPLVDLQVNGYAGIDFQQDNLALETLLIATRKLRAAGCGYFFLTLVTEEWPRLMARLAHLRSLRAQSPELQEAIAGWHIEGPFLSAEPGFCGAHNPTWMCDPQPDHLRELRRLTGEDRVLLTLAPERRDAIAAISLAVSLSIQVSLGHTNAPRKRLLQAIKAGAVAFTHLANGCPRDLDRHDNILWRMFETPGLKVSLIPDMIHVSPALFRLIHRLLGPEAIFYISDAMAAAGAPPGRYSLGHLELEVRADQVVRLPGKPNFAGSALQPVDGVLRAALMLDCSWRDVWRRFSETPARLMNLPPSLQAGQLAHFCLLEMTPENQLEALTIFWQGEATEGIVPPDPRVCRPM